MELTRIFPRVNVVVGGVVVGCEFHAATSYIGAEAAGLDACEVDVPARFYFLGDGFGEPFDGPFGGAVDGECGDAVGR